MRFQDVPGQKTADPKQKQKKIFNQNLNQDNSTARLENKSDSQSQSDIQAVLPSTKRGREKKQKNSKLYLPIAEPGDSNAFPFKMQFDDNMDRSGFRAGSPQTSLEASADPIQLQSLEFRRSKERTRQPQGGKASNHRSSSNYFE